MAVYDTLGNTIEGKNYSGKTFVTFGDSITWYDGHQKDGVTMVGYQSTLRDMGFSVTNLGVSGACIAYHSGQYEDICETVVNTDCSGYDYAFVAGGVNDYLGWKSIIGEITTGNYDNTTICGALQIIVEKIIGDNKDIKLFLMTPLRCHDNNISCDTPNSRGYTLKDYADAIKAVGARYSVPVLDFFTLGGLNEINLPTLSLDLLHPNNAGYAFVSNKLRSFVDEI